MKSLAQSHYNRSIYAVVTIKGPTLYKQYATSLYFSLYTALAHFSTLESHDTCQIFY